jgi:hypothetical protein
VKDDHSISRKEARIDLYIRQEARYLSKRDGMGQGVGRNKQQTKAGFKKYNE